MLPAMKGKGQSRLQSILLLVVVLAAASLLVQAFGTQDVRIWLTWIDGTRDLGVLTHYRGKPVDYPPGSQTLLWLSSIATGHTGVVATKTLAIVGTAAAAVVMSIWFRSIDAATLVIVTVGLSALGLGYLDVLWAPLLIGALWALDRNHLVVFSLLYGASIFVKWQPLLIAPFLVGYVIKTTTGSARMERIRSLAAATIPITLMWIVVYKLFSLHAIWSSLRASLNHEFLSGNALNLPWLLGAFSEAQTEAPTVISYVMQDQIGSGWISATKILFLLTFGLLLVWYLRRGRGIEDLVNASMLGAMAYFMLNTGVHENHLFLASLLAAIGALLARNNWRLYSAVIVMAQLNLLLFYGLGGGGLGWSATLFGVHLSLLLSVLFLTVFVMLAFVLSNPERHLLAITTQSRRENP